MSLDVTYSHWEQCREVNEESVVCVNCYQTKFSLTQVIFKKNIGFKNNSYFKKVYKLYFVVLVKRRWRNFLSMFQLKRRLRNISQQFCLYILENKCVEK